MFVSHRSRSLPGRLALVLISLCLLLVSGCAALSNPVEEGIPVSRLPPEVFGRRKEEQQTIPLSWLRQKAPDAYRLASGDILGIWLDLEGTPEKAVVPPPIRLAEGENATPAIGYPIPIREDGTIALPLVEPLQVAGMTLKEVETEIIKAYTVTKKILQAEKARERIIVTLMKPRTYQVLVVRQDSGGLTVGIGGSIGQTKRGTGYSLELPAYKNDVLNALTRTGGLPGLDAVNEVIIERGALSNFSDPEAVRRTVDSCPLPTDATSGWDAVRRVRIPLRMRPGEVPTFRPEDIVLQTGDIVFIEARDTEVFYTAGLLGARQFVLPRDYDLDVFQAVAIVGAPLFNGALNFSNLSGTVIANGLGNPSPSLVTVLRRTADGGQIPIRVDLNRALVDPRERILIQPGDILVMQETPAEAFTRYATGKINVNFAGTFLRQRDLLGTSNLSLP